MLNCFCVDSVLLRVTCVVCSEIESGIYEIPTEQEELSGGSQQGQTTLLRCHFLSETCFLGVAPNSYLSDSSVVFL